MDGVTRYPPEPWRLGGELLVSAFLVPAGNLGMAPPCGFRMLRAGGRAVVGVAFARYDETGVLAYDELLVGVGGLWRGRPVTHIPQIWVDSEQSRAGGSELWGIPKQLGSFDGPTHLPGVARMRARIGPRVAPGLPRIPLLTAQRMDGGACVSSNLVLARVRRLHADWEFDPAGPLAWMRGRRPLLSVALTDATIVFGTRVRRPRAR